MNRQDKKLYLKIIKTCHSQWLKDPSTFDEAHNRYILEFSDSYLFFYPSTGKINISKNNVLKMIFRDTTTPWLTEGINDKLKELES